MPSSNTDLLRKKKSMFISALTASITPDDVVIPCEFLTGIAQDTAVTLTLDRVDQNGARTTNQVERVTGVVSGDNLIDCLRGQDNTTAISHAAGCVVEDIWDSSTWNNTVDWALVEHNQDGTHSKASVSVTTKGDLQTFSTIPDRLGIGGDGEILEADSNELTGLKWSPKPTGTSFLLVQIFS